MTRSDELPRPADLSVTNWPAEKLVPYARNPRKNDAAVDRMAAAIREFGFRIPIIARSDGTVVDGHLRLKAARALKLAEVPVVLADDLTETQVRTFRLLANRSATWAEFDEDLLALELDDLRGLDFDLELTGFISDELDILRATDDLIADAPALASGERESELREVTFVVSPAQWEVVSLAIGAAKKSGELLADPDNENGNAAALTTLSAAYLDGMGA